jgi:hypothetical protein
MPRLNPAQYLESHRWLRSLWLECAQTFGLISHQDQRYLHDYFLPSLSINDHDLLRHRKKISADQPSLPQCAGRALKNSEQLSKLGRLVLASMSVLWLDPPLMPTPWAEFWRSWLVTSTSRIETSLR